LVLLLLLLRLLLWHLHLRNLLLAILEEVVEAVVYRTRRLLRKWDLLVLPPTVLVHVVLVDGGEGGACLRVGVGAASRVPSREGVA